MKRFLLSLVSVLLAASASAQSGCEVKSSDFNRIVFSFSASENLHVEDVILQGTPFSVVSIDGFDHSGIIGDPSLPTMRKLIEIPLCQGMDVRITSESHVVIDGATIGVSSPVLPVQSPVCKTKNKNAEGIAYNADVYSSNEFYGCDVVSTESVGIARDRNLAEVVFSPVRYNPVTNQFVVYTEVEAVISFRQPDIEATEELSSLHRSPAFGNEIETVNRIVQYDSKSAKQLSTAPIRYLIVAHSSFRGAFDEFINWKRRTGYIVDVAYTDDAGVGSTQSSIKSYIKGQYTNATTNKPAPTYLLLIGDVEQIPAKSYTFNGDRHVSDLDYALWTSDDNIPDCYYGRFSAQTVSQLTPQIEKTLMYERYEFPEPAFLDKSLLIAGKDRGNSWDYGYSHADPAMDYAAKFYVNGDSKTVLGETGFYKFASVIEYKNNTSINMNATGVTVKANSLETEIRNKYSEGSGWINYSAHGDIDCWYYPSFTNSHVALMTNSKKCGVMVGNCCLTGKFDEATCFAEALLRKDNYCGAVAYIGCSNSSYWNQDFYWAVGIRGSISGSMTQQYTSGSIGAYDRLFHTHSEAFREWAPTLGSIIWYGNMSVQNSSTTSDYKNYYWQIYHVFGDPSLMPWLCQAKEMQLTYTGIEAGSTNVSVSCVPHAYVAITDNDYNLIGAAFADNNGTANISCREALDDRNYFVSSIAQNYKPKVVSLDATEPEYTQPAKTVSLTCIPTIARESVTFTLSGTDEGVKYEIFDMHGRLFYTGSEEDGSKPHKVDLTPFLSGTYVVKASGTSFILADKFVVSK